ncbi:MAG: hypothetical protein K6F09_05895, partial [Clostridiales bacterium]|nr:hypothetical protein [Clostridiales bacterium]
MSKSTRNIIIIVAVVVAVGVASVPFLSKAMKNKKTDVPVAAETSGTTIVPDEFDYPNNQPDVTDATFEQLMSELDTQKAPATTAKAPANANTQAQSTNQAATTVPATDKAADDTTTTRKTLASLFTKKA